MCHAFNLTYKNKLASILPYGLYTIPEIGMAGLTEDEARELGINYEVGRAFFSENARGQIIGDMGGVRTIHIIQQQLSTQD